MDWAHSPHTYILYSCGSPMATPYISALKPFTRFCQMDLLNVSIDLRYCSHDLNMTLFFSVLHMCAVLLDTLYICGHLICYFSYLKQLLLSWSLPHSFCHSSMSAAISLKRIAEAESLRYNNETNAKWDNWWKEWIKEETFCEWQMQSGCRYHAQYILDGVFSLVMKLFSLLESFW